MNIKETLNEGLAREYEITLTAAEMEEKSFSTARRSRHHSQYAGDSGLARCRCQWSKRALVIRSKVR